MELDAYLRERKELVDEALNERIPAGDPLSSSIFESVRYSLFAGGKRIRPILCMAAAEALGGDSELVLPVACALEMIHTYSLIHDDLPAMDNDDFRRGKPTNHTVFGENIAILAGDALLTEAFRVMSEPAGSPLVPAERILAVIGEISRAAGFYGMVGGQVVDIISEGKAVDLDTLSYIHEKKTGALITVSLRSGAILAGAGDTELAALTQYGGNIGLAFQIADDILDIEGDRDLLGKDTGADGVRGKMTFPALMGIERSREQARRLVEEALSVIASFDERAEPLRLIARFIIERRS
ncbi:MAG: polyprenyl synthetase family protein [Deltaproteobacteria bacterium]|nr:polyprenyl synthetase family protein [Deltaproteobacteria bacterium]